MTVIEDMIEQQGPSPLSDTPYPKNLGADGIRNKLIDHREVHLLWPQTDDSSEFSPGMDHQPILYHESHDYTTVVREYLDSNPFLIENTSIKSIQATFRSHYPKLVDAFREVRNSDYSGKWEKEQEEQIRKCSNA